MLLAFGINLLFFGCIAYAGQAVAQSAGNKKAENYCGLAYILLFTLAPYVIIAGIQQL